MANNNVIDIQKEVNDLVELWKKHNLELSKTVDLVNEYGRGIPKKPADVDAKTINVVESINRVKKISIDLTEKERIAQIKLDQAREKAFDDYQKNLDKKTQAEQKAAEKAIRESERIIKQKEKEFAKFEKEFNKYEADLAKQAIAEQKARKAKVQAILNEAKALQSLERQKEKELANLAKEQAKLKVAENLYNKVQQKLNSLQNEYKGLATKKELGLRLTTQEEKQYNNLQARIQKYDTVLKGVDATMGKYQRNVGNYASAFNPLSNSINQLTREMPAFTYSVQTGFLALSNNIPIFFDAISQARNEIKLLQEQGKPTKSLFSQLASSLFSWNTAISVGVTLLTVYGKEIGVFFQNMVNGNKSLNKVKQEYSELVTQSVKDTQKEIVSLDLLYKKATDVNVPIKERNIAVKELQEMYPNYFGNMDTEAIKLGEAEKAYRSLRTAILEYARSQAILSKLTELSAKRLDIEKETADGLKRIQNTNYSLTDEFGNTLRDYNAELDSFLKRQKKKTDEIDTEIQFYEKNYKVIDKVTESTKKHTKAKKANKEQDIVDPNSLKAMEDMISLLKKLQHESDITSERYNALGFQIGLLEKLYNSIQESLKPKEPLLEMSKGIDNIANSNKALADSSKKATDELHKKIEAEEKSKEAIQALQNATDEYIRKLASGEVERALGVVGLSSAKIFLDFDKNGQSTFQKLMYGADTFKEKFAVAFQAIGDVAQEVFAIMSQNSQQYFQDQIARAEAQYEYQLQFANGNADAEKQLQDDLAKKKKEIANQEAKAKKEQTIFNILMNTAQGITAALATVPPKPILAGVIGGLGLAQLAMVSSREVPQYYKGRKGGGAELAITDELGAELHTDKHGNIKDFGTNKGARYKWLDAGDIIYTADETLKYQKAIASTFDNKPYNYTQNATLIREKEFIPFQNVNVNIDKNGINTLITTTAKKSSIMNSYYNLKGIKL